MDVGWHVVLNGPRDALADARTRYPRLRMVVAMVPLDILHSRLGARGRVKVAEIRAGIERASTIQQRPPAGEIDRGICRFDIRLIGISCHS
jgi:ribose 1,5-bisphosphokinase PhnN